MRYLPIIGLVAASLVMGSGVAVAKEKHHRDHYDHKYEYKHKKFKDNYGPRKRLRGKGIYRHFGCVHPRKIRRRLVRQGWHRFRILNMNPRVIRMKASNYNGRRFILRVDRCEGYILTRRPIRRFWW